MPGRPAVAALSPADHRRQSDSVTTQPAALFAGRDLDIGARVISVGTASALTSASSDVRLDSRGGLIFGLGVPGSPAAAWSGLFLTWMRRRGFLRA